MVTDLTECLSLWYSLGCPGQLRALSSSSIAPFFFFSFLTRESTAFSAHFSSSSPCFQPSRRFTAGLVKENRDVMEAEEFIMRWSKWVARADGCCGVDLKFPWGVRRQIMRSQDRGRDKRGSVVSLCKQRLLYDFHRCFRAALVEGLNSRQCSTNT